MNHIEGTIDAGADVTALGTIPIKAIGRAQGLRIDDGEKVTVEDTGFYLLCVNFIKLRTTGSGEVFVGVNGIPTDTSNIGHMHIERSGLSEDGGQFCYSAVKRFSTGDEIQFYLSEGAISHDPSEITNTFSITKIG